LIIDNLLSWRTIGLYSKRFGAGPIPAF